MGTAKRERQKANRAARIQAAEQAQHKQEQQRGYRNIAIVGGVVLLFVAAAYIVNRRNESTTAATGPGSTTSTLPGTPSTPLDPTASTPAATPTIAPGATISGPTPCPNIDGSSARTTIFAEAPTMCIDPTKTYTAKVATSLGEFTMALDAKAAPKTVNNFVVLSRYHAYDGTPFHRVIPDFVVQGGDPAGTGSGRIGYTIEDELPSSAAAYQPGVVAMANTGQPNSGSSQFYIVLAPDRLQPQYSIFAKVSEGFDTTIKAIATGDSVGDPIGGTPPKTPATILTVTITET